MALPGPLDCRAIGGKAVKSWNINTPAGGKSQVSRCELGEPLSGLAAVADDAQISSIHVFSPSYLERAPGARSILDAPGG